MKLTKITNAHYTYKLENGETIYSGENKNILNNMFGDDWHVFNSKLSPDDVKKHLNSKNVLDISTAYEYIGESDNDSVGTYRAIILRFNLVEWVKKQNCATYTQAILDYYSDADIFKFCKNSFYPVCSEITDRLTPEQLYECGKITAISDDYRPYKKMSDSEILAAVPEIQNLSGNRTNAAISVIRDFLTFDNIYLSSLHVIYKTTWKNSKTDIKIGQTNGAGGRCKEACFLSWKITK